MMKYKLHLTVSEMNLLIPAIESYIKMIQTSKVPSVKANGKSKVDRLTKTADKLKLLVSYAKIRTQAEKTLKQAEAKERKYNELVFGTGYNPSEPDIGELLSKDLDKELQIDNL